MSHLRVDQIGIRFDTTDVLREATLTVERAEVVALLGPSGSGKTTLLRVIAGILRPDSGSVWIGANDITSLPTHQRGVGMVFQDNQLFPHMSTIDNVAYGLRVAGVAKAERHERGAAWLDRVGLAGFEGRVVTELSGGEAKRVALARTLATEPSVVLLDEPLTGLDRELHDRLAIQLAQLLVEHSITAVLVTHDPAEADVVASRSVRMDQIDGSD
ncbi:ABC transporter ATP-binding protein [uncultured Ilumatobacter sp.]|jgi:thiamine transport system ATP-binding protein|uniref:ABC transporter ATP-binding protein n=1 Tax=Ilumatobacter sp. TaxID=1967498 RepID=UPI0030B585D8|tara:strand:+ start:751 stop:1395 length:645 start_codon:yes stop_codon:yes gene_type:complete